LEKELFRASQLLLRPNPDLDEVCELIEPPLTKAQKRAIAAANAAAAADITLQSDATPGDTSTDNVAALGAAVDDGGADDATVTANKPRRRRNRRPNRSNRDA